MQRENINLMKGIENSLKRFNMKMSNELSVRTDLQSTCE